MKKEARIYKGGKTVFSINAARKTRQLHVKKMKSEDSLTQYTKLKSKWIKDLNAGPEENIGRTLCDINHRNIFLNPPLRVMKINKWDLIKLKSFCTTKKIIKN